MNVVNPIKLDVLRSCGWNRPEGPRRFIESDKIHGNEENSGPTSNIYWLGIFSPPGPAGYMGIKTETEVLGRRTTPEYILEICMGLQGERDHHGVCALDT